MRLHLVYDGQGGDKQNTKSTFNQAKIYQQIIGSPSNQMERRINIYPVRSIFISERDNNHVFSAVGFSE